MKRIKQTTVAWMALITGIIFGISGCAENHYYDTYHHHSREWYDRHHTPPPPGVNFDVEVR